MPSNLKTSPESAVEGHCANNGSPGQAIKRVKLASHPGIGLCDGGSS
jgi:hypothetical protein